MLSALFQLIECTGKYRTEWAFIFHSVSVPHLCKFVGLSRTNKTKHDKIKLRITIKKTVLLSD